MFNYGIGLLRILAAVTVVWLHFGENPEGAYVPAVPIFVVLSFFLAYEKLAKGTIDVLTGRIYRLLVPYWFWGFVYWILFCAMKRSVSMAELFWQLLLGHSVCRPLYFYFILILLTALFYSVMKTCGRWRWILLIGIFVGALILQYSGMNYTFANHFPAHAYVMGRIAELMPYGVIGILLAMFCKRDGSYISQSLLCLSMVGFIAAYVGYNLYAVPQGYGYQGFQMIFCTIGWVAVGICLGRLFSRFRIELPAVQYVSSYMMGVYCLHYAVGKMMEQVGMKEGWLLVVFVFACSFSVSVAIARVKILRKVVS